jgi:hypothetical protein
MTSEDWDMLPDVEDLEKIVNRELKKLEEFEKQKMMILVEEGKDYRIFKGKLLFIPYYVVEDTSKAVQKSGVWNDVELTTYYFKTLKQIKNMLK